IEITRVRRLHFRNSDERDRIANVQMRDLRLDNIATEVSPNLFASDSTSLAIGSPVANSAVEIQTADRVAGALCGALSSLGCLTASGQAVVNLFSADSAKFLDALTGVAFSVSDADGDAALLAAAGRSVMRAIES